MNSATIETSPPTHRPSLKATFDLFMSGQISEAGKACDQAFSIFPGEPRWMHLRGLIAARLGKKREALSLIKQSVDLRPDIADFHANFGMMLAECGRLPESIRSLRRALQLNPGLPTAWRNLGLAFRRAGRADEALEAFYRTARLAPEDHLNWQDITIANLVTGEVESAMASMRQLMEAKPSDARLHSEFILSMHYLDTIKPSEIFDQSREWAERFAQPLYPSSSQPYRNNRSSYLASFGGVWVHLDTFPYNGHTTTCDALWMGVPTVSMAGTTHVQRAGCSVLSAVGLSDLVADSPQQYLQVAIGLANDRNRLADLRQSLRGRLQASPLGDAAGLTREIERVYRAEWQRWCNRKAPVQEPEKC